VTDSSERTRTRRCCGRLAARRPGLRRHVSSSPAT
jgi:hypothetical protein